MPNIIRTTIPEKYIKTKKGFDWLAHFYEPLLYIMGGHFFRKAEKSLISEIPQCDNILIIGGGNGHFLLELISAGKAKKYHYLDISEKMLESSINKTREVRNSVKIDFIHGNWDAISRNSKYDLICTNFFLDLFTEDEVSDIISFYKPLLTKGGLWLVTDLHRLENNSRLNPFVAVYLKILYHFFRITTAISAKVLPELDEPFQEKGFRIKNKSQSAGGILESVIYQLS